MNFAQHDHQIIATVDGQWAGEISFPPVPGNDSHVVCERTFVVPQYRGRGLGKQLVHLFVKTALANGWVVKLMCPFAKLQFTKHPEYRHLLQTKSH